MEDESELASVFPSALEAAARRGLLLSRTHLGLSLRGALVYNETDVLTLQSEEGEEAVSVEVAAFEAPNGAEYLLHSPLDPVVVLCAPVRADGGGCDGCSVFEEVAGETGEGDAALSRALEELQEQLDVAAREL